MTTLVFDWSNTNGCTIREWLLKSLRLLQRILIETISGSGKDLTIADGVPKVGPSDRLHDRSEAAHEAYRVNQTHERERAPTRPCRRPGDRASICPPYRDGDDPSEAAAEGAAGASRTVGAGSCLAASRVATGEHARSHGVLRLNLDWSAAGAGQFDARFVPAKPS